MWVRLLPGLLRSKLKNLSQNAAKSIEIIWSKQNKRRLVRAAADAVIERAEVASAPVVTEKLTRIYSF